MITRTFRGAVGAPKAAVEPVNQLVTKLNAAGYGCAIHANDFGAGKFFMTGDTVNGFAVTWEPMRGLAEVAA